MPLTLDNDGYLANLDDWNTDAANQLATLEGLSLIHI